jgi:hypothetical protein
LRIRAACPTLLWALLAAGFLACHPGGGTHEPGTASPPPRTDTSGQCAGICDASPRTYPIVGDSNGYGDVTTYGGTVAAPSLGGACNYGQTGILNYAAIQVNRLPGDMQGQWRGGRVCGQCVEVRARTTEGWKSTVVRIVDKCPDDFCGIDLGGAPAGALMGDKPGRYAGEWSFIPCDGHPGVSDGAIPPRGFREYAIAARAPHLGLIWNGRPRRKTTSIYQPRYWPTPPLMI